jgi:hypothetical protein
MKLVAREAIVYALGRVEIETVQKGSTGFRDGCGVAVGARVPEAGVDGAWRVDG